MKEIIVAIDFSKGSLHALDYAIELANHQKSNLTMVWVDNNANFNDPCFYAGMA